ncbi:hypothetical protein CDD80_5791 [Ophiocordyceps camponoti-rufipedis]|uniref:Ribosomal protein L19 n=1 Tax=Ophiocordyceps camponoti-rufipedis TaxID=2004952 RepID=A0A2C5YSU1_9HYPO|nr:hypothetical protein CDD80_5791 [Ophiocordyceps camponoti-rufipedis]
MNAVAVAVARRPAGCFTTALAARSYATTPLMTRTTTPITTTASIATPRGEGSYNARQRIWKAKLAEFKVWPQPPTIRSTYPDPMPALKQKLIDELDVSGTRSRLFSKKRRDSARVGDVLLVSLEGREPFAGVFIQIRRSGPDTSIQLRGALLGTGVEMWFKIYSPNVTGINIISRRTKRARRARLTYMRKPKHDRGDVDHLVLAWQREKQALTTVAKTHGSSASSGAKKNQKQAR